ncbi:hypothetical protein GXM_09427 [Nostoc sphaeroides CCNUC1]|uniref:Uncharacterized protein n=1 Tax=Nostoc sphaeroides CCNUC1 TaxID=2653204 RepID=A0A5P8WGH9_9NOSO|nr:hypothetical protein GXM_09427 [Nostoc sphaeroides CCNUC1]
MPNADYCVENEADINVYKLPKALDVRLYKSLRERREPQK